nr:helix-turn-helix domain-containing protein [Psychromicrobium silvestre]
MHTPSSAERMARGISYCAPAEFMDPTPFLSPNALLLTNGMGLNISDDRTWDAYVERLARVPVAAIVFGTGPAHQLVPPGLSKAAAAHGVPLLEVPGSVPGLQVHRYVSSVLEAERFALTKQSWELAERCSQLVRGRGNLSPMLRAVAQAVSGEVAVVDAGGSVLLQWPKEGDWKPQARRNLSGGAQSTFPLPASDGGRFSLLVRNSPILDSLPALLGPVCSIIAVHLSSALNEQSGERQAIQKFLSALDDWHAATSADLARLMRSTGLSNRQSSYLIAAAADPDSPVPLWLMRLALQEAFGTVRFAMEDGVFFAFGQEPIDAEPLVALLKQFREELPQLRVLLAGPAESLDQLRLDAAQVRHQLDQAGGSMIVPGLGLQALIAATAGRGAQAAAQRLLAPLLDYDRAHQGRLLDTLEAYLAQDAHADRSCAELFIHRNTLNYRLKQIEGLLDIDLKSLENKANCLIALRLYRAAR